MKMLKNTLFAGIKAKNKDSYLYQNNRPYMVREMGLEPTRRSPHAPQTCLSTIPTLSRRCLSIIAMGGGFVNRFFKNLWKNHDEAREKWEGACHIGAVLVHYRK